MPKPYFFFHPILAADQSWAAVDWQSGTPDRVEGPEFVDCFNESQVNLLADTLPMILTSDPEWFDSDVFIENFDPSQVIFVLPAACLENSSTVEKCRQHQRRGYRFGLHIDRPEIIRQVPLATFDFLRFEAAFAHQDIDAGQLNYVDDAGFGKIATKVGSYEMFGWLSEKQFDFCDCHFLMSRNPNFGKKPDLTRLKLLKLLQLVKQDGDTREIEAIFREEPKLSYNLLRLVNSVAVGARTKINSFSQAIAILGRRQLQRWLQLLIYANNLADGNTPNPLMQLAARRGRQLELLCISTEPNSGTHDLCENAFIAGLFSLLDVLINLPMTEILKELPIDDVVVEALLSPGQGGIISQLLSVVVAAESGQFSQAQSTLHRLKIDPLMHTKAQVDSLYWASRINVDNHD